MKPALFGLFPNSIAFSDLRWTSIKGLSLGRIRIELLSGLTVALALVPEAVAFAFVAGVHPLVGLLCGIFGRTCHCAHWWAPGHDLGGHRSFGGSYGGFGG